MAAPFRYDPRTRYVSGHRVKPLPSAALQSRIPTSVTRKPLGWSAIGADLWTWMREGEMRDLVQAIEHPSFLSGADFEHCLDHPAWFTWSLLTLDLFVKSVLRPAGRLHSGESGIPAPTYPNINRQGPRRMGAASDRRMSWLRPSPGAPDAPERSGRCLAVQSWSCSAGVSVSAPSSRPASLAGLWISVGKQREQIQPAAPRKRIDSRTASASLRWQFRHTGTGDGVCMRTSTV